MATLLLSLDASNSLSWTYTSTPPNPCYWLNVSGYSLSNTDIPYLYNVPQLVTEPTVKGVRVQATTGGTYPNGTYVGQRLQYGVGDYTTPNSLAYLCYAGSYSISMWIKFNQAPISGSTPYNASNQPTWIFAAQIGAGSVVPVALGSNLGDTVTARNDNRIAVRFYDGSSSYIAGAWSPTIGIWYNVTIVCEKISTYSGNLLLYVNGALNGSTTITAAASTVFGPLAGELYLNGSPYNSSSPDRFSYGGDITFSTFQIWGGARTSAEIAAQFATEQTTFGYAPPSTGPTVPLQPSFPTLSRIPNSMYNANVWRTRSRGDRWIVPARDDYRISLSGFSSIIYTTLFPVPESNSVIDAGEFGAFVIGDQLPTFEMLGISSITLAALTGSGSGTIT